MWKLSLLVFAVVMGLLAFVPFSEPSDWTSWLWSANRKPWWQEGAGAAVTKALFAGAVTGLLASLWNDLFRCPWLGFRIRKRIRNEPACVLHPRLGERRIKLVPVQDPIKLVPRVELFDDVLGGLLARDRKGVQIIVGEPGSGKTTALIELAAVLARIGVLPIVLPLRAKQQVEDLVRLAKDQFTEQIDPFVRSGGEAESLWRWLCRRKRVAVLVDDLDQIGPDGERGYMLRRAVEEAAARELPILVTLRPAGVPAGIAASSIELGRLDDATAADCVERGARGDPAYNSAVPISRRRLEDWIREGGLAEVPFYLELLAHLVAGGRCPKLPGPDPHEVGGGDAGRYISTPDGGYRWNRLWVRFLLLERFYEEAAAGRVRRWVGIEASEARSALVALEGAALGTLAATGIRTRRAVEKLGAAGGQSGGAGEQSGQTQEISGRAPGYLREGIEEFIETNDREPVDRRNGGRRDGDPFLRDESRRPRVSAHEVVDTGERLRILDFGPNGEVQFRHRIMQAYLAGCRLALIERDRMRLSARRSESPPDARKPEDGVEPQRWVDDLLHSTHPEKLTAQMALTFAALAARVESEVASRDPHGEGQTEESDSGGTKDACAWQEVAEKFGHALLEHAEESLHSQDAERSAVAVLALTEGASGPPIAAVAVYEQADGGVSARAGEELSRAIDPKVPPQTLTRTDPDDALAKLTAAAEIACAVGCDQDVGARIVEKVRAAHFATRWTKLEAIRAIAQLRSEESWACVWQFARDKDYRVRQEASAALEANAFDAFKNLCNEIEMTILRASARSALGLSLMHPEVPRQTGVLPACEEYRIDTWDRDAAMKLKALAWILPAIVSGLRQDPAAHAREAWRGHDGGDTLHGERPSRSLTWRRGLEESEYVHFPDYVARAQGALEQLVALAFQGDQMGLEEALALGFKGDAMRHAHGGEELAGAYAQAGSGSDAEARVSTAGPGWVASNRRLVLERGLEHAESWYARLLLCQALALYTIAGAGREEALDAFARFVHRGRERHPFTQRGARLARAAVFRVRPRSTRWHDFIWDDEGPVAGRTQATLNRTTAQLAADVTVLLDLKDASPEDRRAPFGAMHQLPHCLSASRDRAEILGKGCPDSCGWGFCPYKQPPPDEPNAYRGVTRAFCRQQQRYARFHRPRWQRGIRRRKLRAFWEEMEHRART